MARAESGVRYPGRRSRFSRFLLSRAVFRVSSIYDRVPAPLAAGRSCPLPAVRIRTRSDLCCGPRECARASHLAASSRASPVAGPHGHNNGPCAACLPAVIVLSVSRLDAGLVAVLPVRCRSTPSGRRESPKGLEAPGQAELKPRPAGLLCAGGPSGLALCPLSDRLCQVFPQRFPIVGIPAVQQVLRQAHRETRMVKDDFGLVRLLLQVESDDGIRSRLPACGTPCLDNSLVRHKFDVASHDVVTE